MKLNFWQWLGVILLVICGIWYVIPRQKPPAPAPNSTSSPMPAAAPATVPSTGQAQP